MMMQGRPGQQQRRGGPMGGHGPMGGGPMAAMMPGAKARDFKGTMRKLIEYLGAYRLPILIVLIFAIASTAANIVGPKILGNATTKLFEGVIAQLGGSGTIDFNYIGRIVLLTIGLYLVSALFAYIQGWIMANISTNIAYRFRQDLSRKINRMPLKYFDGTTHGEVLSRITNDVDTVNQTLSQSLVDDTGSAGHHPTFDGNRHADRETVAEILQATAGIPGPRQRSCRGNVRRTYRHEGVQW
jgi:ATP-binding cassette subfamily B protein